MGEHRDRGPSLGPEKLDLNIRVFLLNVTLLLWDVLNEVGVDEVGENLVFFLRFSTSLVFLRLLSCA